MRDNLGTTLVNREKEMELIMKALANAQQGKGRTIIISGETGIGKTRLLEELRERCMAENIRVYWGSGIDENAMPYHPYLNLIQKNREIIEELKQQGPNAMAILLESDTGAAIEGIEDMNMESRRLKELVFRMIKKLAKQSPPVVLLFDDIQWFDPSSITLLHHIARNIQDIPVLICCSYNTEEIKESKTSRLLPELRQMNIERIIDTIELKPLPPDDVKDLIKYMTRHEPKKELVKKIYEKTDGNPLFIEELVKTYGDKIVERGFEMEEESEIPQTVKYIITRKLDKMDANKKKLLTIAAVYGREFHFNVIQKLSEMDEEKVLGMLEQLIREGVLFEKGYEEIFCFRHNLMREVIYSTMNSVRKRQIHIKIADELAKLKTIKNTGDIALHYYLGGALDRAFPYAKEAGENFAKLYAVDEALRYMDLAIRCIENTDKNSEAHVEILRRAMEISYLAGRYMDTITYLQKIEEIANEKGDANLITECNVKFGETYFRLGAYEEALFRFEDAISRIGKDDKMRGRIYRGISSVFREKGKLNYAIEYAEHAIELARKNNDMKLLGDGYMDLALAYYRKGEFDAAIENIEKSVVVRQEIRDERGLMTAVNNLGAIHMERGHYEDAYRCFDDYLKFAEKIGDLWGIAIGQNNLGVLWSERGDLTKSLAHYQNALDAYMRVGDENGAAITRMNMGIIYHYLGDYETAIDYYTQCLRYAESQKDLVTELLIYDNLGYVHLAREVFDEALLSFEKSLELAQMIGAKKEVASVKIGIAETYARLGFYDRGMEYADDALSIAKEMKVSIDEARARRVMGIIYMEMQEFAKAKQELEKSYRIVKEAGNLMKIIEIHETLLDLSIMKKDRIEVLRLADTLKNLYEQIGAKKRLEALNRKLQNISEAKMVK